MEGTISEIRLFGANFAPRNWALCNGQLLAITQYQALFSLLGTMYGGDGRTTFGLPDMRSRTAVGVGQGPGLSNVKQGGKYGVESVTLNESQIPSHTHSAVSEANASVVPGTALKPPGNTWAASPTGDTIYGDSSSVRPLAANAVVTTNGSTGGSQAHENRSPELGLNFIICLEGLYPSRS